MTLENIKGQTKEYLKKFVRKEISEEDEIITSGLVNSLFAMQLVLFIEKEFELKVENNDLDIKNFNSIQAIALFVSQKKGLLSDR